MSRHITRRRGRDSNPRTRLTPVTRFPVAPVQPLRHLSSTATVPGGPVPVACGGGGRRQQGYGTVAGRVARLRAMVLAISRALYTDIGLIATFGGIGVIVNVIIVYIAIQIRGERQQNREYRERFH